MMKIPTYEETVRAGESLPRTSYIRSPILSVYFEKLLLEQHKLIDNKYETLTLT